MKQNYYEIEKHMSLKKAVSLVAAYLAANHLDVDFDENGQLCDFFRKPNFTGRVGCLCYVFDYQTSVLAGKMEEYNIYVKIFGKKLPDQVKCLLKEKSSFQPHPNWTTFNSMGRWWVFNGERPIEIPLPEK